MVRCTVCSVPIDIDEQDDYTVRVNAARQPVYTCYSCAEPHTESNTLLTVSEIDLNEG
jgi:hypothetical protein